jgi:hypothetical protein
VWEKRQSAARFLDSNAVSASVAIQMEKRTAAMLMSFVTPKRSNPTTASQGLGDLVGPPRRGIWVVSRVDHRKLGQLADTELYFPF